MSDLVGLEIRDHIGIISMSLSGTADTREGVRAFLEKRPPVWTGR